MDARLFMHLFDAGIPVESTEPTRIRFRYSALPNWLAGCSSWSALGYGCLDGMYPAAIPPLLNVCTVEIKGRKGYEFPVAGAMSFAEREHGGATRDIRGGTARSHGGAVSREDDDARNVGEAHRVSHREPPGRGRVSVAYQSKRLGLCSPSFRYPYPAKLWLILS